MLEWFEDKQMLFLYGGLTVLLIFIIFSFLRTPSHHLNNLQPTNILRNTSKARNLATIQNQQRIEVLETEFKVLSTRYNLLESYNKQLIRKTSQLLDKIKATSLTLTPTGVL